MHIPILVGFPYPHFELCPFVSKPPQFCFAMLSSCSDSKLKQRLIPPDIRVSSIIYKSRPIYSLSICERMGIPEGGIFVVGKKTSSIKGRLRSIHCRALSSRIQLLLSTIAYLRSNELQVQITHYHRQNPVTCSSEMTVSLRKISHFREKGNEILFPMFSVL